LGCRNDSNSSNPCHYTGNALDKTRSSGGFCPFCEGNEGKTPPEIYALRKYGSTRNYINRLKMVLPCGDIMDLTRGQIFIQRGNSRVRLPGGAIQLITKQGYNQKDSTQRQLAENLLEREHRIGREYFASGGGYRLEGYFKTLKGVTW